MRACVRELQGLMPMTPIEDLLGSDASQGSEVGQRSVGGRMSLGDSDLNSELSSQRPPGAQIRGPRASFLEALGHWRRLQAWASASGSRLWLQSGVCVSALGFRSEGSEGSSGWGLAPHPASSIYI